MSWLSGLFSKSIADPIEAIGNVADELFTSDEEKAKARFVLEKMRQQPQLLQIELAKVEAQHRNLFVAGGRPFIIWVCGVGLSFVFLINPVIQWVTGEVGPAMPTDSIINLVYLLLGLGGYRTVEKALGKTK